jgi:signal transduction histidine kinase/CheY-like chemotaxis protein
VVFAALRLAVHLATGRATPWAGNAGSALVLAGLYLWYRRDPARRSSVAVHGIAAIAVVALLIPAAYGLTSSKWWIALVGFATLLMSRRREAIVWTAITAVLVPTVALVEPYILLPNAVGEPPLERAMSGFFFVIILLGITWAFWRVAQARARELTETAASLTRANAVKSRFLAHMSHEVRTPIHAVIAMTDMALAGDLSLSSREFVQTAQDSARLLLSLLNNVLDVSRAESDAVELDGRSFALHETLAVAVRPLAAQARAKTLDFAARADPGIAERRIGDRVRVTQIALNLVGNALKFTKAGRIELRLRAKPDDADRVVLEVADTGPGIPKDRQEAIFEPFTQASAADAGIQSGAGLGLAIVRDLARRMNGDVKVESEVGRGARFTVELSLPRDDEFTSSGPVDLLRAFAASRPPEEEIAGRPLRVLVCEDNTVNQKVILAMLGRLGHRATIAGDGLAAWELLEKGTFDLLVTDVEMPGLDGLELARRVRAREATANGKRMPIVGATAHVGAHEEHRLIGAGMDAHLGKPFTLADLTKVLRRVAKPEDGSAGAG